MSEKQKEQAAVIAAEMSKLTEAQRENALTYIQGMAAAVKLMKQEEKTA